MNLVKNPMWLFYATLFPFLIVLIMGYLTKDQYGTRITSYDYYGISLMIYSLCNSGMTSANAFMEERIKKPNMRIIYAPGSNHNIFLSKIIASFLFCSIFHFLDFIILVLVFHIHIASPVLLFILMACIELFSVTLGIMICCIVKAESTANQIQSIVVNLFAILGGAMFSIDSFGKIAKNISLISPVKWMINAAFELIYDHQTFLCIVVSIGLVVITAGMILICKATFHKEDCIC